MKFLHALEFDQALLAHIAFGVGGPLKTTFHHLLNEKKFGELWSTDQKVIDAHVDTPNCTFFGILHFGR